MTNENVKKDIKKDNLWKKAYRKFIHDKIGVVSFGIVALYGFIALGVIFGWWANDIDHRYKKSYSEFSSEHLLGTNKNGEDILSHSIYSTKTAFEVGLIVAIVATILGAIVGCLSGFFSGTWIDEFFLWIIGCLDCMPFYLFVAGVALLFERLKQVYGHDFTIAMHVAMIATFWTATARLVRGEVIKLKNLEFVEAAYAIGVPRLKIIFKHIFPNTTHILLVQATIAFVSAIKSEVILSYLGLGVKNGSSWGRMISEASQEIAAGHYGNFLGASVLLFILVMAFNMFADALQDALDPKKVS